MRKYLNENDSHISFSFHTMKHLVNFRNGEFIYEQKTNEKMLKKNLDTLFAIMFRLIYEAFLLLNDFELANNELSLKIEQWRKKGLNIVKE